MNWAFAFMALQVVSCLVAGVAFIWQRNYPIAWVWVCYGFANMGFAYVALKGAA